MWSDPFLGRSVCPCYQGCHLSWLLFDLVLGVLNHGYFPLFIHLSILIFCLLSIRVLRLGVCGGHQSWPTHPSLLVWQHLFSSWMAESPNCLPRRSTLFSCCRSSPCRCCLATKLTCTSVQIHHLCTRYPCWLATSWSWSWRRHEFSWHWGHRCWEQT
jgi:hypothetical protein